MHSGYWGARETMHWRWAEIGGVGRQIIEKNVKPVHSNQQPANMRLNHPRPLPHPPGTRARGSALKGGASIK